MGNQEILGLQEAYASIYAQQEEAEQLDETRTDPRGRPASGPMSVYGGRGKDAGPGHSGDERTDRMDAAQRRVKATKPAKMGMAADALHTKYSARRKGLSSGYEEGPGAKSPKRGGRKGRGAETDRGKGNAAARRMREEFEGDLFDYLLEYLVAEGYADTNKAALAIMANMSEEWRQSIVEEKRSFPFKRVEAQKEKARQGSVYGRETKNEPSPQVSDTEKKETTRFSKMHHASEKAKREKQEADKARRSPTFYKDTHPASASQMKKAK